MKPEYPEELAQILDDVAEKCRADFHEMWGKWLSGPPSSLVSKGIRNQQIADAEYLGEKWKDVWAEKGLPPPESWKHESNQAKHND